MTVPVFASTYVGELDIPAGADDLGIPSLPAAMSPRRIPWMWAAVFFERTWQQCVP